MCVCARARAGREREESGFCFACFNLSPLPPHGKREKDHSPHTHTRPRSSDWKRERTHTHTHTPTTTTREGCGREEERRNTPFSQPTHPTSPSPLSSQSCAPSGLLSAADGTAAAAPPPPPPPSPPSASCMSDVHSVRLSRRSCMMRVLSLYDSSPSVSSSAIASSNACLAKWHARSGELRIS